MAYKLEYVFQIHISVFRVIREHKTEKMDGFEEPYKKRPGN